MYRIEFDRRAQRDLRSLSPKIVRQIQGKIGSLAENPRPQDTARVISMPGVLRVDSGEYRILYEIDDKEQVVTIARIRHRREAYR